VEIEDRLTPWSLLQSLNDAASTLRTGDQVLIAGSLLSNQYKREAGKGKKPTSISLTSWQIRANVIRKLNRTAK
jgi:single-stranded DNA-binding protein